MTDLIPVVAALIAAIVAFVGLVVTKEQKVSEFRQQWIESLRKDLCQLIALLEANNVDNEITITEIYNRIVLSLNSTKDTELRAVLENAYQAYKAADVNQITISVSNLRNDFQKLFKIEWERVKAGELVYKITKWALLALVVLILIVALSMWPCKIC